MASRYVKIKEDSAMLKGHLKQVYIYILYIHVHACVFMVSFTYICVAMVALHVHCHGYTILSHNVTGT